MSSGTLLFVGSGTVLRSRLVLHPVLFCAVAAPPLPPPSVPSIMVSLRHPPVFHGMTLNLPYTLVFLHCYSVSLASSPTHLHVAPFPPSDPFPPGNAPGYRGQQRPWVPGIGEVYPGRPALPLRGAAAQLHVVQQDRHGAQPQDLQAHVPGFQGEDCCLLCRRSNVSLFPLATAGTIIPPSL